PLSYAVLPVIASSYSVPRYAAAVVGAELIFVVLRFSDHAARWRVQVIFERLVVAAATVAAYGALRALTDYRETGLALLPCLGSAAVAQIPVDLAARSVFRLQPASSPRTRLAWLAIASS